ncbi:hypothetical protein [Streptacidiphilus sp. P02-A3a]|uniref:hypothetical protein n=1 Tax=Streptacidiphilus sp. P02-A3a TaxID=2704468 RepID=UPI0015FB81BC|nr:hypothetical protein [Streptacidiphilus sp. P02-A3a]QMU67363.1 hypothetical protein GXP74_03195 [Streptacidiphilus sp. P02-A3a]
MWSSTTAGTVGGTGTPVLAMALSQQVSQRGGGELLASVSDPAAVSSAEPDGPEHTQMIGFDPRTGRSQAMPLLGDAYTATSADVNGDGVSPG